MSGSITRRTFFGAALAGLAAFLDCSGPSSKPADGNSGLEEKVTNEAPAQKDIESPKQEVLEITRDNYRGVLGLDIKDKAELDSRPPMFVMITSDSCPPCRVIFPVFKEGAGAYKREDVSFAHYKANFNIPGTKYFKPELPAEIPIIKDWDVCGVPDVALLYKGELKWNKNGSALSPMWGDNGIDGVTGFKNLVEDLLKQYCRDCSYLNKRRAR